MSTRTRGTSDLRGVAPAAQRPIFEAVGDRCAFAIHLQWGGREPEDLAALLAKSGMRVARVDPVAELQSLIDRPWRTERHLRFRTSERAAQWAYGRKGVRIPGTALEQLGLGQPVPIEEAERGDLIFARANGGSYLLGLFTGEESVLGIARRGRPLITKIPLVLPAVSAHLIVRRPVADQAHVVTVFNRSASEIFDSRDIERLVYRPRH